MLLKLFLWFPTRNIQEAMVWKMGVDWKNLDFIGDIQMTFVQKLNASIRKSFVY